MKMTHIRVKHDWVDGAHFITGADNYTLGLCAGHVDPEVALKIALHQTEVLLQENHGIRAKVIPGRLETIRRYQNEETVGQELNWMAVEAEVKKTVP